MRFLTVDEITRLHTRLIKQTGGIDGLRDTGGLESAVHQPQASFGGEDLYPTLEEKAAALGFSLINNHAFLDGNKRIGHAAVEVFLMLNGYQISADVDIQEELVLGVAAGHTSQDELAQWLAQHVVRLSDNPT